MQRRAVVLGLGGSPDAEERAAVARLTIEGYAARYVRVAKRLEREPCELAVSRHADLLRPYPLTERIVEKTPEVEAEVPQGFPALPPGYSLFSSGPRWSLRNENGTQVHDKMLYKGAMIALIEELTHAVE